MRTLYAVALVVLVGCDASFDRAKWESGAGNVCGDNPRPYMLSDAERAGLRPGASRDAIRDLLGPPDSQTPTSDGYMLGAEPTGVDCHHMTIVYDADGRVVRVDYIHG